MLNAHARRLVGLRLATALLTLAGVPGLLKAQNQGFASPSILHKVQASSDRVEMTVNTSRILTLEQKIPRAQVNNPEMLDLTPLAAQQIQIHAKKTGVTQVNLWDERGEIHSIDVIVYGDVAELAQQMQALFPSCSIKVMPTANGVLLNGYVDRPDYVSKIRRLAEVYYPNVQDNIIVGGAQQVLLHVKVMEVSRTKLRDLGFDFANISGGGQDFAASGISGLLGGFTRDATTGAVTAVGTTGAQTFTFGIVDPNNAFFGVLRALQRNSLMKVLAEPTLVTVSGRPAYFQAGGEVPVLIPQGLGTVAVEYRRFGTQVDFVPIVLGQGNIRLEVRPRVSELDNSIAVTLNGNTVPGFRTREVDTGVELKVGQTLALAGLIQNRVDRETSSVPWLGDLPYVGVPFRRVRETNNEVELLIMVRPELAEALDCEEVPPCGPGEQTTSPSNWDLYMRNYMEVPKGYYGPPGSQHHGHGPQGGARAAEQVPPGATIIDEQEVPQPPPPASRGDSARAVPRAAAPPAQSAQPARTHTSTTPPPQGTRTYSSAEPPAQGAPVRTAQTNAPRMSPPSASNRFQQPSAPPAAIKVNAVSSPLNAGPSSRKSAQSPAPTATSAPYKPSSPSKPQTTAKTDHDSNGPGLIGPIGYDVSK